MGTFLRTTDFSTSYHQVALTPETQKLGHSSVGNEQYNYKRGTFLAKNYTWFLYPRIDNSFRTAQQNIRYFRICC